MLQDTTIHEAACAEASSDPALLATDLADFLVRQGVAFRDAHHLVGQAVALAEKKKMTLAELTAKDYQSISKAFKGDLSSVFNLQKAMAQRVLPGSPGPKEVKKQLARWKRLLKD
jgi:argininosuccinate lyase